MEQGLPKVDKCKVVIVSITYNQSKYIDDTLNGFAIQQTNFPFLCCVFDDASTDGEQEVLKQWINNHCNPKDIKTYNHPLTIICIAPDKDNPNCIYAIHLQKVNTWGKPEKKELIDYWIKQGEYVAMCEGDDYWIDSNKLQYQINFLDLHPEYSYSCHRYKILEDTTGTVLLSPNKYFESHYSEDYFTFDKEYIFTQDWVTKTLTSIYRTSHYWGREYKHYNYRRDIHLVYELLCKGKGICHSFVGGVFRRNNNSTYNSLKIIERIYLDYKIFKEFYVVTKDPMFERIMVEKHIFLLKNSKFILPESFSELSTLLSGYILIIFNKIKAIIGY